MAEVVDIGSLISRDPNFRGGRPCIAGTGMSVRCVAQLYQVGTTPEDIVRRYPHISLAQVHAALSCYHANQDEIDADLQAEADLEERLALELYASDLSR